MANSLPPRDKDIEQYKHKDKTRLNNPQVGMVSGANDPDGSRKRYSYDPHLDPTLQWAGKKEQSDIDVDTVSIHVHERIDPKTIVYQVHKKSLNSYAHNVQIGLFEQPFDHRPVRDEVSFYQHKNAWANRLIAGDSLLVMNSLLEKEGMAGQVQMVYIDPPYGIKYGSNFQPYVNQTLVKDGKDEDLNTEPEMIKAFRDTWELGVHSYLSYLRDRMLVAAELMHETGSIFVQISDENLHHVRELMDEIFGAKNFLGLIFFKKTGGLQGNLLSSVGDYIVWYGKNAQTTKYHQLYNKKKPGEPGATQFRYTITESGDLKSLTAKELLETNEDELVSHDNLTSQGNTIYSYVFKGKEYRSNFKPPAKSMDGLVKKGRVIALGNTLRYIRKLTDFPYYEINQSWDDLAISGFSDKKVYVVQTAVSAIQRCMLMTTDVGDLTLDPTCGSGTTAFAAEKWGRRWITIDTSRIAIQLAKQRLLTSGFDWYKLAHENEGVSGGFVYNQVPHITLSSLANDEPPTSETLYDQPIVDKSIIRVSGPFTVEAIPAITVKSLDDIRVAETADNSIARTGETARQDDWRSELLKTGVRTKGGDKIEFARVELIQGTRYLHAEAETTDGKRVLVSFGPDHAPLEQKQVELALEEAQHIKPAPVLVLFAAFQFDPEASKDIDETNWAGVDLLKVQMNTDLLTADLKKSQSSSESFWLVGQPDVQVRKNEHGQFTISVEGFDYYDPKSGEVQSGGKKQIAMWMLDTDYDGRSIFPTQVFFPMAGAKGGWSKLAKSLKAELDESLLDKFEGTESIPFDAGDYKRCAVKIIDNRGIESFTIKNLD